MPIVRLCETHYDLAQKAIKAGEKGLPSSSLNRKEKRIASVLLRCNIFESVKKEGKTFYVYDRAANWREISYRGDLALAEPKRKTPVSGNLYFSHLTFTTSDLPPVPAERAIDWMAYGKPKCTKVLRLSFREDLKSQIVIPASYSLRSKGRNAGDQFPWERLGQSLAKS